MKALRPGEIGVAAGAGRPSTREIFPMSPLRTIFHRVMEVALRALPRTGLPDSLGFDAPPWTMACCSKIVRANGFSP